MFEKTKHAELLLEYGANPSILNEEGLNPLQVLPRDAVRSTKLYFKKMFEVIIMSRLFFCCIFHICGVFRMHIARSLQQSRRRSAVLRKHTVGRPGTSNNILRGVVIFIKSVQSFLQYMMISIVTYNNKTTHAIRMNIQLELLINFILIPK